MTTRRLTTILGILVWSAVALTASSHTRSEKARSAVTTSPDATLSGCSDLHFRFDHRDALVQSETREITKAEASTLRVTAEQNGGIDVEGWDKDSYSVTLCKGAEDSNDAQAILDQIHMSFQNGDLGVTGPSSHQRWAAHFLIRSPKAAALELTVYNGPLSLHQVDGQIQVHAKNGPVSVVGCSGEMDLNSQNGPLTLEGNRGKQTVHAQNGPVSLSLSGDSWEGAGVDAQGTNGPLTVRVPPGYKTGVLVQSEGHSPFECRANVCSEGRKTWDDDHKQIEFGSGPTLVRVSTVNGPVSVN
jgi:hypothetical protein